MNVNKIKKSLVEQKYKFNEELILNPVENVPFPDILEPCNSFLHGLYNTDTERNNVHKYNSKIQFSGRDKITQDIKFIYSQWSQLLHCEKISMRLLSGLHAHIVIFMGITSIGDKVMYLPEKAGGHLSGLAILRRLGLHTEEIPFDSKKMCIDRDKFWEKYCTFQPSFIFIDRSEGLVYEDFSWICEATNCYKIFDASQYLTNIICNDYKNPFDMGFDLIISTMHKNLPGPQQAFVAAKQADEKWDKLRSSISTYVSNMHVFSIYSAGLLLEHMDELKELSSLMLQNTLLLDQNLDKMKIPIIHRICNMNNPLTHHCWIHPESQEQAFKLYLNLEKMGILTNYRLLPYDIGYGLRLGLSGATMSGLRPKHIPVLAKLISNTYNNGYSRQLHDEVRNLIVKIKKEKFSEK